MSTLALTGCRPEPLGSYLKALAVLRLVGGQVNPATRGRWSPEDTFVLSNGLGRQELVAFFLDDYRPTPLVAPWNSSSGFDKPEFGITDIEGSAGPRLEGYRRAIVTSRKLLGVHGSDKDALLQACRAELPDDCVDWMDAGVVLTEAKPAYAAVLGGTGGNLGRLELSRNFMA